MAEVLRFPVKEAPVGWANEELAEFYRIVDVIARAGLLVSVSVGVSDEGDPWVAFVRDDTGDVLAHIARIDGWVFATSAASNELVRAQTLKAAVRRIVDSYPLATLRHHERGSNIFVHPCAVFAAFIMAAYMLADGLQAEAKAREIERPHDANREEHSFDLGSLRPIKAANGPESDGSSLSASPPDGGAAVLLPPGKSVAQPNPLRSALTSISDYLRGITDFSQPLANLSAASFSAVVAIVFAEDEGERFEHNVTTVAAIDDHAVIAMNALEATTGKPVVRSEHAYGSSEPALSVASDDTGGNDHNQPLIALERTEIAAELSAPVALSSKTLAEEATAKTQPTSAEPSLVVGDAIALVQRGMAEPGEHAHSDRSAPVKLSDVNAAADHAAKTSSTEIHAYSQLTGDSGIIATKPETVANAIKTAAIASQSRADTVVDSSVLAVHLTDSGNYFIVRVSDLSKSALSALHLSDLGRASSYDLATTSDLTTPSVFSDSLLRSSLGTTVSAVSSLSADAAAQTDTTFTADKSSFLATASTTTIAASESATAVVSPARTAGTVADGLLQTSTPSESATSSRAAPSSTPSAYEIISEILDFAFDGHALTAKASTLTEIRRGLTAETVSGQVQKVLVFSSESIKQTTFEFTPGIVMIDRSVIAEKSGGLDLLPVGNAGEIVHLADGAFIRLIGVIDMTLTV